MFSFTYILSQLNKLVKKKLCYLPYKRGSILRNYEFLQNCAKQLKKITKRCKLNTIY